MEYSLADIFAIIIKRLTLIIVCTFIGFSSFYIVNRYLTKPSYTASVQMYVNPNISSTSADLNELNYAQKVISTYVHFLETNVFYVEVIKESKLNYTAGQLKAMTSIHSIDNTEIFQISVTSFDPEDPYRIVEAMQNIAPGFIKSIKNTSEISIVDPVVKPTYPSGPNVSLNTLVGGLLGFLLAIIVSFLWEIIDVKIKDKDDLSKKYSIPILGSIPNYNNANNNLFSSIPVLNKNNKNKKLNNIAEEKRFAVNEAYNELRTNMRFTLFKSECKKIVITSPLPEEGKSTTSANLAITIAQTGAKVILLDCDLRKGKISSYFNLKSKPGMSDILSGLLSEKDVTQDTKYEKMKVITMGSIPPNPTELLGSTQMEELLKRLEKNFDYIIIDSPPVNVVSDALTLAKMVDGVAIVVREGVTTHPNIDNAIEKYKLTDANILGFVVNGVAKNQGYRTKSHYYYRNKNG